MSLTWCQIGASLCLIGVSAWAIEQCVKADAAVPTPKVAGPAMPAEETAAVVRWAMERAGIKHAEAAAEQPVQAAPQPEQKPEPAPASAVREDAPATPFASTPAPSRPSTGIGVPQNARKGGGKVSYVSRGTTGGGGGGTGSRWARGPRGSGFRSASNWVPQFSGSRRRH